MLTPFFLLPLLAAVCLCVFRSFYVFPRLLFPPAENYVTCSCCQALALRIPPIGLYAPSVSKLTPPSNSSNMIPSRQKNIPPRLSTNDTSQPSSFSPSLYTFPLSLIFICGELLSPRVEGFESSDIEGLIFHSVSLISSGLFFSLSPTLPFSPFPFPFDPLLFSSPIAPFTLDRLVTLHGFFVPRSEIYRLLFSCLNFPSDRCRFVSLRQNTDIRVYELLWLKCSCSFPPIPYLYFLLREIIPYCPQSPALGLFFPCPPSFGHLSGCPTFIPRQPLLPPFPQAISMNICSRSVWFSSYPHLPDLFPPSTQLYVWARRRTVLSHYLYLSPDVFFLA